DGYATVTQYDWRMRPARVDSYDKGIPGTAPRLTTTLTYLDHADRVRFVVTFGPGDLPTLSGHMDPVARLGTEPLPTARELWDLNPKPIAITESVYSPDGHVVETRRYDMGWTAQAGQQPDYHAEQRFLGVGGQEVFTRRPDGPVTVTTLDGVGRAASVATVIPGRGTQD